MKTLLFIFLFFLPWGIGAQTGDRYELNLAVQPDTGRIQAGVRISTDTATYPGGKVLISLALNQNSRKNPELYAPLQEPGPDGFSPSWARLSHLEVNGVPRKVRFLASPPANGRTYNLDELYAEVDLAGLSGPLVIRFDYEAQLSHQKDSDDFYFENRMFSRWAWFPRLLTLDGGSRLESRPFTGTAEIHLPGSWTPVPTGTAYRNPSPGVFQANFDHPGNSLPLLLVRGMNRYIQTVPETGQTLVFYFMPASEGRARLLSTYAKDALVHYKNTYQALDLPVLGVVEGTPGTYALAAEGSLILGGGLYGAADLISPGYKDRYCDYLVAREIGQFYFGVDNGLEFQEDNSLRKGFNEASTQDYIEGKYSRWDNLSPSINDPLAALASAQADWGRALRIGKLSSLQNLHDQGWDDSLSHEAPTDLVLNSVWKTNWVRAPFVLHMLASEWDGNLNDLLRETVQHFQGRTFSTAELQSFLEKNHQTNLEKFFTTYIRMTGWLDYSLEGTLNQEDGPAFVQNLTIADLRQNPVFVPTNLTLRLEDGSEKQIRIEKPGPLTLVTDQKVRWAAVDFDADTLDFERKNNFLPPQVLSTEKDPRFDSFRLDRFRVRVPLINTASSTLMSSSTASLIQQTNPGIDLGAGIGWTDNQSYQLDLGPIWNFTGANDGLGILGRYTLTLPRHNSVEFLSRTMTTAHYQDTTVTWNKIFYLERNLGTTGRWFSPVFALSAQTGVLKGDWTDPSQARFQSSLGFTFDNLEKSGSMWKSKATVARVFSTGLWEERLDLNWSQLYFSWKGLMVGTHAAASWGMGEVKNLPVYNAALGISPDQNTPHRHALGAEFFTGIPLLNHIEMPLANLFVLQSIHTGVFYAVSTAWETDSSPQTVQHALGLGLVPVIRSLADKEVNGPILGLSFDLNTIGAAPTVSKSYTPKFFLDFSNLTQTFARMASY